MRVILNGGMGDALNTRAFLYEYMKNKNVSPDKIIIYTKKFKAIFKNDGFKLVDFLSKTNMNWFQNFGWLSIRKIYISNHADVCLSKNSLINFNFNMIHKLNWNTELPEWVNLPEKFVTVNYGSDNARPEGTICIKLWKMEYWEELVKNIGIPCVQIGAGKNCKEIKGTSINLMNKLNIYESAEVMKRALFHIDIEGGLPILNQHLGGKSVVLFGPTAIEDKGRDFNLNLKSSTCGSCYGWGRHIDKLCVKPGSMKCKIHCMTDLKPDYVIEQIYKNKWL